MMTEANANQECISALSHYYGVRGEAKYKYLSCQVESHEVWVRGPQFGEILCTPC